LRLISDFHKNYGRIPYCTNVSIPIPNSREELAKVTGGQNLSLLLMLTTATVFRNLFFSLEPYQWSSSINNIHNLQGWQDNKSIDTQRYKHQGFSVVSQVKILARAFQPYYKIMSGVSVHVLWELCKSWSFHTHLQQKSWMFIVF